MDGIGNGYKCSRDRVVWATHNIRWEMSMNIHDGDWERIDRVSEDDKLNMITIVSDVGTASTMEQILFHTVTRDVYRKRFWFKSSYSPAGEVWYKFRIR